MSTSDFKVVSWSSPKTDAASTGQKPLKDQEPGTVPIDRRPDDPSEDLRAVRDDNGILEIVELICHNVAIGKGLGQAQGVDTDRAVMCETFEDESARERGLRSDRNLDRIIELINDS